MEADAVVAAMPLGKENVTQRDVKVVKPSGIPRRVSPDIGTSVSTTALKPHVGSSLNAPTMRYAKPTSASTARSLPPSTSRATKPKGIRDESAASGPAHVRGSEHVGRKPEADHSASASTRKKFAGDSDALLAFTSRQAEAAQAAARNDVDDVAAMSNKVKVYLRVRPVDEKDSTLPNCLEIVDDDGNEKVICRDSRPGVPSKQYDFNRIFNTEASNEEVYRVTCKPLLDAVMNGFNGTLLAYGQTGSGKTHTMGSMATFCPSQGYQSPVRGMIPMVIENTFARIAADTKHKYKVCFSYVQIYQDDVYDLLTADAASDPVPIREHPDRGVYLEGCSDFVVQSPAEVNALLQKGRRRLVIAETKMNRQSSRSHALCFITIECLLEKDKLSAKNPLAKKDLLVKGKITLCDLAGSERVKRSESTGDRLAEAQHINSSLHELGNVVSALAAPDHQHIPFRNCALTRILQESLGGNCKTSLIVCSSPLMRDEGETKGTLSFGQRAMCVVQNARINVQLDYRHLANELARQLEHKESDWDRLEGKLKRKIAALEKEHMKQMAEQQRRFELAQEQQATEMNTFRHGMDVSVADTIERHKVELEAIRDEHEAIVADLRANEHKLKENARQQAMKSAKEMAQRRQARKKTESDLQEQLNSVRTENQLLHKLVAELESNTDIMEQDFTLTIESEKKRADLSLQSALDAHAAEMRQLAEQSEVATHELSEELRTAQENLEVTSALMTEQHSTELKELHAVHSTTVAELEQQADLLKAEVAGLRLRIERPMASTECQTESQMTMSTYQQTDLPDMSDASQQMDSIAKTAIAIQATPEDFGLQEVETLSHPMHGSQDENPMMLTTNGEVEVSPEAAISAAITAPWGGVSGVDVDTGFPAPTGVVRRKKKRFLFCFG